MAARPTPHGRKKREGLRFPESTANTYRKLRQSLGTQKEVARMLKIHKQTVCDRECGRAVITTEAMYAMRYLTQRAHR